MDFTILPRPNVIKRFAHYSFQHRFGNPNLDRIELTCSGFYYIGTNRATIEKLVKIYKSGYAAESFATAKSELNRIVSSNKHSVPEVIFCDSHFDSDELHRFCHYLKGHAHLYSTPFILDGSKLSEKDLNWHKNAKLVDEILLIQNTEDNQLKAKCQFLRKVKLTRPEIEHKSYLGNSTAGTLGISIPFKRVFDILVALVALCILSPIFLLVALAIRIESKGPIFYISKRAGMGYRIFDFYKFRTMRADADKCMDEYLHLNQYSGINAETGPLFIKIKNDPRITRVGAFLRNTSIDELPQLINVVFGDMSLVGNRPLPLYEAATLTTDACARRFMAPAGITGLWQIKKRGKVNMSVEERINLDIDYAEQSNFIFDLWIIANTPSALIQKSNA